MSGKKEHAIVKLYGTGFAFCYRCGLVLLKNKTTIKALRRSCGT